MKTLFLCKTPSDNIIEVGAGSYDVQFVAGMRVVYIDIDPLTHVEVAYGSFLVESVTYMTLGYRTGEKALWKRNPSYGPGYVEVMVSPMESTARAYVADCEQHQYGEPTGEVKE